MYVIKSAFNQTTLFVGFFRYWIEYKNSVSIVVDTRKQILLITLLLAAQYDDFNDINVGINTYTGKWHNVCV